MEFCTNVCNRKRNIVDYCKCKLATNVTYTKLKTTGNDPTTTQRLQYASLSRLRRGVSSSKTDMNFQMNIF